MIDLNWLTNFKIVWKNEFELYNNFYKILCISWLNFKIWNEDVVNSLKKHINKILDVWSKVIKQPKQSE